MGNVTDFPRSPSGYAARTDREPVAGVIGRLEELLAAAKAGKIRSFAAATVEGPGVIGHCWAETDGWFHEVTSGIETLKWKWMCLNADCGHEPPADQGRGA